MVETERPDRTGPDRRCGGGGGWGYLLGGAGDQALVQPLGLLLREALGLVVPHQSSLDLDKGGRDLVRLAILFLFF